MGVFAAAGLDFAELEQAASVDEDDEWTPPVVRDPPAGRRQPQSPSVRGAAGSSGASGCVFVGAAAKSWTFSMAAT